MLIEFLIFAALAVGGVYVFVPSTRAEISKAWTTAKDDLDKLYADGEALVKRYEAHAVKQTAVVAAKTAEAQAAQTAASVASTVAKTAADAAAAVKAVLPKV